MNMKSSTLGSKGEIVHIRRVGEPYSYLTVMVLGTRLLNIHEKEGTIEIIDPRAMRYAVTPQSPEIKLSLHTLGDPMLEYSEAKSFYRRLLHIGETAEKLSTQRTIVKYCRLREDYLQSQLKADRKFLEEPQEESAPEIHSDAPHARATMDARGELWSQILPTVH